jgi:hypothetical protein
MSKIIFLIYFFACAGFSGELYEECDAPLFTNDVEDVVIRVLEPSDLHIAGNADIALSRHVRQVVVLKRDALDLERLHDIFHILADHPRHSRGLVASGVLRLIEVDRGVFTPEDDQFLAFSVDLCQAEHVFIEFPGRFQILDCDVCGRIFIALHVDIPSIVYGLRRLKSPMMTPDPGVTKPINSRKS